MKKIIPLVICTIFCLALSGCGLVEGAFKAGLIFGLVIIAIIGLVIYLLRLVIRQIAKSPILKPKSTKLDF